MFPYPSLISHRPTLVQVVVEEPSVEALRQVDALRIHCSPLDNKDNTTFKMSTTRTSSRSHSSQASTRQQKPRERTGTTVVHDRRGGKSYTKGRLLGKVRPVSLPPLVFFALRVKIFFPLRLPRAHALLFATLHQTYPWLWLRLTRLVQPDRSTSSFSVLSSCI